MRRVLRAHGPEYCTCTITSRQSRSRKRSACMAEWVGDDDDGDDDDVNGMPSWAGWIGGLVRGAVYEYSCVCLGAKKLFIALHRENHVVYILSNKCHAGRRMISCLSHIASSFTACNISGDLIRYRVLYLYSTRTSTVLVECSCIIEQNVTAPRRCLLFAVSPHIRVSTYLPVR